MKSDHVLAVDATTFQAEVLESALPVLVDVGATWCPPCRALEPIVESVAAEYQGRLKVVAVNSDASPALCARYGLRANPTLILFNRGQEITRHVGLLNRQRLIALFADRVELGSATTPAIAR
jgi:thioredoxin